MRTLGRAPGLAPGDVLNQALIRVLPPKTSPYSQAAIHRFVEGVMALHAKNDPTVVKTSKEGVNVADLQETVKLSPTLQVAIEVRNAVISLTFSPIPSDSAVQRASSGRVAMISEDEANLPPAKVELPPLPLDGRTPEAVEALMGQLKSHDRLGNLPETLAKVLTERLTAFCVGGTRDERFNMPEMLWSRLQLKEDRWLVKVEKLLGAIGVEIKLTRVGSSETVSEPDDDGTLKDVKKDISFVRVDFSKWENEQAVVNPDGATA